MRVYLFQDGSIVYKQVEIGLQINETFDETLDTATITIKEENNSTPYAPMTAIYVDLQNTANEVLEFYIVSDVVSLFSRNPLNYKHELSLIQNTRKLSKYTARNSVFTQPASKYKEGFSSCYFCLGQRVEQSTYTESYARLTAPTYTNMVSNFEKLTLESKEKAKKVYIEMDVQVGVKQAGVEYSCEYKTFNNIAELNALLTNTTMQQNSIYIYYTDSNNTQQHEEITVSDIGGVWRYNQKLECPKIKQLFDNGYTNIFLSTILNTAETSINEALFTSSDGKFYTEREITPAFFMIQFKIFAETYYNSVYDVLDLLIKRQKQQNDTTSKSALFNLPSSGDLYDLLNDTIAPNFTFTQCTMFDCISEVFKLFDATFTLKNGVLGIEYLNQNTYPHNTYSDGDFSSLNISIAEDKYNNGFITYYQDARTIENFPAQKNQYVQCRSNELGVPSSSDHYLITPHNIYNVIKCEYLLKSYVSGHTTMFSVPTLFPAGTITTLAVEGSMPMDISKTIQPQTIWNVLPSYDDGSSHPRVLSQNNTLYFVSGDNKIQFAWNLKTSWGITYYPLYYALIYNLYRMGNFDEWWSGQTGEPSIPNYSSVPDWKNLYFRLEYETTLSGKSEVQSVNDKYRGDTYVSQDNGAVDLNKLGLNVLGLSYKLGEPSRTMTRKIDTWDDRVKKGEIFDINNEVWLANICSYTFFNNNIIENIQFVKNYNALAQRTRLLREKRFSNISSELVNKSEDIIIEYCYFYDNAETFSITEDTNMLMDKDKIFNGVVYGSFAKPTYEINYGIIDIPDPDSSHVGVYGYLPLIKYGFGNCVCFEMSLDSSINIGNWTTELTSGWWGSATSYYTKVVKYTDDNGFKDTATIKLVSGVDNQNYNDYPIITSSSIGNVSVNIPNLKLYKQPNEIFALNYEICFLAQGNIFLGQEFINNRDNFGFKQFYIYYTTTSNSFRYSVLDTKGEGTSVKISGVSYTGHSLTFTHPAITDAIKTWSICDGNGNIYFASNNSDVAGSTTKTINFIFKHNRI